MALTEDLTARIDEITAGDATLRDVLLKALGEKPEVGQRFVNSTLGRADVTRKQQEAADLRRSLDDEKKAFETQKSELETRLEQSETEKASILTDLQKRNMTVAQAKAAMDNLKLKYALDDSDFPTIGDLIETSKSGKPVDSSPDIDERLRTFGEGFKKSIMDELTSKLVPELSSLANLNAIWNDIGYEHQELTGKRLTRKDQEDIIKQARSESKSVEQVWKERNQIEDLRFNKRLDAEVDKRMKTREEEAAQKRTEAMLNGRDPNEADQMVLGSRSPVLDKKFGERFSSDANTDRSAQPVVDNGNGPVRVSAADREAKSGAARAKERFLKFKQTGGQSEANNPKLVGAGNFGRKTA